MQSKWIIYDHHLAIEDAQEILHPNAQEIFTFVAGDEVMSVENPVLQFPDIRFSKVGSPVKCELIVDEEDRIIFNIYAIRKNDLYPVDIVQGYIIDQCVSKDEWFYLNSDIESLQNILSNAEIDNTGEISIGQYLKIIKQTYFTQQNTLIENKVDKDSFVRLTGKMNAVPAGIKAELYEYQKQGYSWIYNMVLAEQGCILGDEMGLGKTLQIITVLEQLKYFGKQLFLVIAPVSLLENWKRECNKFAPDLDVYIHHGAKRTGRASVLKVHDVIVISYNTAVSDLSMLKLIKWKCVILDEAQNIKNPFSERAKAVKSLGRRTSIAVTGTPFENHVIDIWSLVDFVSPGLLGDLATFKENVSDDVLGAEKIEPVLSPIMIRRLVRDVANDLPEKIIIPQPLELSDNEKREYQYLREEANKSVQNGTAISLGLLQKLRIFCTHPSICAEKVIEDPYSSSVKYQRFCEIIEEIINRNEKFIVFTSYKKMFDLFALDIPQRFGIKMDSINGETPVEKRQSIVDWFNNYEGSAMLALNPRAAGTGLNITGANHVIHFNLEWNPALEDQASARAYRRGQKKNVFIYRLFYVDTVEQVVNERIERKREIASTAVVGTDGSLDKQDIMKALEISPDFQRKDKER